MPGTGLQSLRRQSLQNEAGSTFCEEHTFYLDNEKTYWNKRNSKLLRHFCLKVLYCKACERRRISREKRQPKISLRSQAINCQYGKYQ